MKKDINGAIPKAINKKIIHNFNVNSVIFLINIVFFINGIFSTKISKKALQCKKMKEININNNITIFQS